MKQKQTRLTNFKMLLATIILSFFNVTLIYADTAGAKAMLQNKQETTEAQLSALYQLQLQEQTIKDRQKEIAKESARLQHQQILAKQAIAVLQKREKESGLIWQKETAGHAPKDAIIAGYDNQGAVHICQAYISLNNEENMQQTHSLDDKWYGLHPGQLTAKGCQISYAGKTYLKEDYFVLAGKGTVQWQQANIISALANASFDSGNIYDDYRTMSAVRVRGPLLPPCQQPYTVPFSIDIADPDSYNTLSTPIIGGSERNHPLYICRAIYQNGIRVGKVIKDACNISGEGAEQRIDTYEVLTSP